MDTVNRTTLLGHLIDKESSKVMGLQKKTSVSLVHCCLGPCPNRLMFMTTLNQCHIKNQAAINKFSHLTTRQMHEWTSRAQLTIPLKF
jgi:hypothetical protein